MVSNPIVRNPSEEERRDFHPLVSSRGKFETPKDKFLKELNAKMEIAHKKGQPFADKAALDEWEDHWKVQAKKLMREFGFIKESEVSIIKMDWAKYSDLSNFELINEGETRDPYESKRQNKEIFFKFKVYKYRGYINKYRMMEPYPDAWKDEVKAMPQVSNKQQEKV